MSPAGQEDNVPDLAVATDTSTWVSTTRMDFRVECLPPVRRRLMAEVVEHHIAEDAGYDAALVLAELVSNALRHGRPMDDGQLQVSWGCWDDQLHVHVTDGGTSSSPEAGAVGPAATSGRGLSIVKAVSSAWGVQRQGSATTVWAALPAQLTVH